MRPIATLLAVTMWAVAQPAQADGPLGRSIAREAERLAAMAPATSRDEPGAVHLRWDELAPIVVGKQVVVHRADGTVARGEVLVVRSDMLVMATGRARSRERAGLEIARPSVQTIDVQKANGKWGRKLGSTIGTLCGIVIGGYVAGTTADSAPAGITTFLGISAGMTLAGYYVGRQLDTAITRIRIVP